MAVGAEGARSRQSANGLAPAPSRLGAAAWAFYDWANSAFPTVIITFVFAAYFTKGVAENEVLGTQQWGYAISLSALFVAILSPVFGAISDHMGQRKPWILAFTIICIALSASLWWAAPKATNVVWVLAVVAAANLAFEMAVVFYNAMLPDQIDEDRLGRLSGWAWGLGYAGGLCCLALCLALFVQAEAPLLGLDKGQAEHLRIVGPITALWMGLFAVPFFLFTEDRSSTGVGFGAAVSRGLKTLWETLRQIKKYRAIARFLLARMIYTDGLTTLFAFGGIYAASTFGFTFSEVIIFGIFINVTAGLGAAGFAWLDDWRGSRTVIILSIVQLVLFSAAVLMAQTKEMFWIFGLGLGFFVGSAQASSRALMARMVPDNMEAEMFGLYALSGKATAFMGPALLAFATGLFDSQRAGMATILLFFIGGLWLMRGVPDIRR